MMNFKRSLLNVNEQTLKVEDSEHTSCVLAKAVIWLHIT